VLKHGPITAARKRTINGPNNKTQRTNNVGNDKLEAYPTSLKELNQQAVTRRVAIGGHNRSL